jgi:hypothetical protein
VTVAALAGALLLWGAPIAPTAPPAAPERDGFWTAEERPVRLRLVSPATRRTGQGIFLRATISLEASCVHPGPVFWIPDSSAGAPRQLRARVWRQHDVACDRVARLVEQTLHVWTREPGIVRFVSGDDNSVIEVKVSGKPYSRGLDDDRGKGPCRFDEDCWVTEVCVPRKSDPLGPGICAQICDGPIDCVSGRCDRGPGIVGICSDRTGGCSESHPCEWGQVCGGPRGFGFCRWPTQLSQWTRHDCKTDNGCDPGLKCVQREGEHPRRRCEMPCSSAHMECEGKHACRDDGICEWLGE